MSKVIKACFVINDNRKIHTNAVPESNHLEHSEREEAFSREMAASIYQETKQMVEEMVIQAQNKADQTIIMAREEAEKIRETSRRESQVAKEAACREGFEQGYREGLKKGDEEIKARYAQVESLLKQLKIERDSKLVEQEKDIIALVMAICRKILATVLEMRPEAIRQVIVNSLEQVKDAEKIIVRVNPIHLPYLSGYEDDLKEQYATGGFQIIEDPGILPGDCVVYTESGFVESRMEEQLEIIKAVLMEELGHAGI